MNDLAEANPGGRLSVTQLVEASAYGVGRHVLDLSAGLVARGVTVDLVYGAARTKSDFVDRLGDVGFRSVTAVDASAERLWASASTMSTVRRLLRDRAPDIVHGHSSVGGGWARLLAPKGAAVVYTPNAFITQSHEIGAARRRVFALAERVMSRRTDGLISVSVEEHAHACELRLRPATSRVIPNGVDPDPALPSRVAARARLDLPVEAPVVGFVGRLSPQKGLPLLLDATRAIVEKTGAVIAVVGDGPDLALLRERAAALGVDHHVRFLGHHNGRRLMRAFDVLAVPSRYEGFPYVVLEALAAGVPVVATTNANASLVLADGRAGRAVPAASAPFAAAIVEVLSDSARSESMQSHGPGVARRCSIDAMVDATLDLYRDVAHRAAQVGAA